MSTRSRRGNSVEESPSKSSKATEQSEPETPTTPLLPDLTLEDQDGNSVQLTSLVKDSKLLIYFYPKADTPGCTKQACALRDLLIDEDDKVVPHGVHVVGISPDKPPALKKFANKYKLPFTLLSDPKNQTAKALGAFSERLIRSHFLFDIGGECIQHAIKVTPASTAELLQIKASL